MKQITSLLIMISLLIACNSSVEEKSPDKSEEQATQVNEQKKTKKTVAAGTYLCKINGKDWAYTKASGIISTHAKTKKRTALITFNKKLEKGSEVIQLYYDANSFELISTTLQLKFKDKEGKLFTCYYGINSENISRHPQSTMSGSIDISDPSSASGTADLSNINIQYEKEKLFDSNNAKINIEGLKFSGVGYSDTDKLSNAFK